MKHIVLIVLIIGIVSLGIFLPYIPGDYDYFVVGLSTTIQFAAFTSLLLVPIGLIWTIIDVLSRNRSGDNISNRSYLMKAVLVVIAIIYLAAALGSFASQNRFSAIIILVVGAYIIGKIHRKESGKKSLSKDRNMVIPYYLIIIPLTLLVIRMSFLEKVKTNATNFVIKQAEQLIHDIEAYKLTNGNYPLSLQSTIEDYKPNISGIQRFHYELNGNAYNIYFEQFSDVVGTQEIVMYNRLGEQEMTVHNQDLLRIAPQNIYRGYHAVDELPNPHWKIFYFD